MSDFQRIYSYNAWANDRILGVVARLDPARASQPVEGIYGSVLDTTRHLLGVEVVYLRMMGGATFDLTSDADGAALHAFAAAVDAEYGTFVAALTHAEQAKTFTVPWFKRDFTVADGLLQVATHSIEHRADLASALTRLGMETPPIDYVFWVIEQGG